MYSGILENLATIRSCFSKASIAVSSKGISAIYTNKKVLTQSFFNGRNENGDVFRLLTGIAEGIQVTVKTDSYVSMAFIMPGISDEFRVYPPLENDESAEEFLSMLESGNLKIDESKVNMEFVRFMANTNFYDDEEVAWKFSEWQKKLDRKAIVSIPALKRYERMAALADELRRAGYLCVSVEEPHGEFHGGMSVEFSNDKISRNYFGRSQLEILHKICEISEGFDADVSTTAGSGFLTLSFYV